MRCRSSPIKSILGLAAALALPAFHAASSQPAVSLFPQASPPTIELAVAPENKFDGEWKGTLVGEQACGSWNIPLKATVRNGVFSTVITISDLQNEVEGPVGDDGQLSFWAPLTYKLDTGMAGPLEGQIHITGRLSGGEFQGTFDAIGGNRYACNGEIRLKHPDWTRPRLQWARSTPAVKTPPSKLPRLRSRRPNSPPRPGTSSTGSGMAP